MKINRTPSFFEFDPHNIISNHEIYGRKMTTIKDGVRVEENVFNEDGLFSPSIFGNFETEHEYSCKCGFLAGKFYDGFTCPKCNTVVTFKESLINKMGWIDISGNKYNSDGVIIEKGEGYKIIKYIAYNHLEKLIGKANLRKVMETPNTITATGELDTESIKLIQESSPECKYWYIGLVEFYKKYHEVLEYYYTLNNVENDKLFEFLYDPAEVWTDKIPVISTLLRPAVRTTDGLKLDILNTIYVRLIKNNKILNSKVEQIDLIKNSTLEIIQAEYFQLSEEILKNIKGKSGLIRSQICGTRIDFSARNIITPAHAGIKMDEVVIPYLTMLELYKFEVINILHNVNHISIREAEKIHFKAMKKFNPEVYNIMKKMIKDGDCSILLNRNPTIAIGSMLCMKIADVKEDYTDLTLSLSNTILTLLAADFDGDVLNIISLKDNTMKEIFKAVLSPEALIIDSNNGNIKEDILLERDQILGLNALLS